MSVISCSHCNDVEDARCQECCEHEFDPEEGFMCLMCDKEGAEDVYSVAYDRWKDLMKYGE